MGSAPGNPHSELRGITGRAATRPARDLFTSTTHNNPEAMNPNTTIETKPASLGRRLPLTLLAIGVALCGAAGTFAQSLPPWSTVDDIENGWQESVAADGTGNIFVAGSVTEAGVDYGCLTKSSNQGATCQRQ